MISFRVYGLPAAQGSKTPWGSEANPRLKPWRQDVAVAVRNAMGTRLPTHEPVELQATFFFPRPKAHFGTGRNAGKLKDGAPLWVAKAPDLDKLVRALGDAITGVAIRDDCQVVVLQVSKQYAEQPGVEAKVLVCR